MLRGSQVASGTSWNKSGVVMNIGTFALRSAGITFLASAARIFTASASDPALRYGENGFTEAW